jgi:excisionase family DNA binding protein
MEKFYKLTEIARMLRVSPLTVRRWINEGKLKAFHPAGTRLYRVPESSLKEFVGAEWWEKVSATFAEAEEKVAEERRVRRRRR